jgi:hypothetical protein
MNDAAIALEDLIRGRSGPHVHNADMKGGCGIVPFEFRAMKNRAPVEVLGDFKPVKMLVWPTQIDGTEDFDIPLDDVAVTFELCTKCPRWHWFRVEGVAAPPTGARHFVLAASDGVTILDPTVEQFLPTKQLFGRIVGPA